jgi:hypothetical protein
MPVFLLVAVTAVHGPGTHFALMRIINYTGVTVLTGKFLTMDGGLIFVDVDMPIAFLASHLVAFDAGLICIVRCGLDVGCPNGANHQQGDDQGAAQDGLTKISIHF